MNFAAFFSYVILMTFTPGPNNIMAMTNAGKYGFRGALPFNLGVFLGVSVIMSCCAAFSSLLYELIPTVKPVMLCLGAAYILWLAWKVWRDSPHAGTDSTLSRTNTVISGIILQLVNVKIITFGLTVMASFILPHYRAPLHIAGFVLMQACMSFLSTACWAAFGAVFDRLFKRHGRTLNAVMALLLVYCAVTMLRDVDWAGYLK